jgi:hypothetical protein
MLSAVPYGGQQHVSLELKLLAYKAACRDHITASSTWDGLARVGNHQELHLCDCMASVRMGMGIYEPHTYGIRTDGGAFRFEVTKQQ